MVSNIDFSNFSGFFKTGIPNIVFYPSIILCIFLIFLGLFSSLIKGKKTFVFFVLFIEYLFVVISSTVLCRCDFAGARIEATPFWDYIAIVNKIPGVSIWDIILNIVLFLPFGFLLSAIKPTLRLWVIVLLGLFFSFCIESMQYIFSKGIAQMDDLMHNSLGALLGVLMFKFKNKIVEHYRK